MSEMTLSIPGKDYHAVKIHVIKHGQFKGGKVFKLTEKQVDLLIEFLETIHVEK